MCIPVSLLLSSQKCQGVPFCPNLFELITFAAAPLALTPFVRRRVKHPREAHPARPGLVSLFLQLHMCVPKNHMKAHPARPGARHLAEAPGGGARASRAQRKMLNIETMIGLVLKIQLKTFFLCLFEIIMKITKRIYNNIN